MATPRALVPAPAVRRFLVLWSSGATTTLPSRVGRVEALDSAGDWASRSEDRARLWAGRHDAAAAGEGAVSVSAGVRKSAVVGVVSASAAGGMATAPAAAKVGVGAEADTGCWKDEAVEGDGMISRPEALTGARSRDTLGWMAGCGWINASRQRCDHTRGRDKSQRRQPVPACLPACLPCPVGTARAKRNLVSLYAVNSRSRSSLRLGPSNRDGEQTHASCTCSSGGARVRVRGWCEGVCRLVPTRAPVSVGSPVPAPPWPPTSLH